LNAPGTFLNELMAADYCSGKDGVNARGSVARARFRLAARNSESAARPPPQILLAPARNVALQDLTLRLFPDRLFRVFVCAFLKEFAMFEAPPPNGHPSALARYFVEKDSAVFRYDGF
jgi:hypothetical protein